MFSVTKICRLRVAPVLAGPHVVPSEKKTGSTEKEYLASAPDEVAGTESGFPIGSGPAPVAITDPRGTLNRGVQIQNLARSSRK